MRQPRRSPSACAASSPGSPPTRARRARRPRAPRPGCARPARRRRGPRRATTSPSGPRLARERLAALDRSLAQREGLPPGGAHARPGRRAARAGRARGRAGAGARAVAAALGHRASALLSADPPSALALIERARAAGLGSLVVLVGRDPRELVAELELVPLEALLGCERPAVTEEGIGFDPVRGELWFAGETAEALLLELEASRRALAAEAAELSERAEQACREAERAAHEAARARAEEESRRPHPGPLLSTRRLLARWTAPSGCSRRSRSPSSASRHRCGRASRPTRARRSRLAATCAGSPRPRSSCAVRLP